MTQDDKPRPAKRSRWRRWLLIGAAVVILVVVSAVVVLRLRFNGPRLANTIEQVINNTIRGEVQIGTVEWPLSALPEVVTGGWIPVTIRDLKVYDDRGELVLETPTVTGELHSHSLMFGGHDFVFRNVRIPDGGFALIEMVDEPYPLHEYDTEIVSLISAFYPQLKPGYRAGLTASTSPRFDIRDLSVTDVDMQFKFPELDFEAEVYGVDGDGFLYFDPRDPLAIRLYYALHPTADRGTLRSLGYTIDVVDIVGQRLEQLPHGWPRDPSAQNIEWAATATTPTGARVELTGGMYDWWDNWFGGDYKVALDVGNAGALVHQLSEGLASGDDLTLNVDISGPVLRPKYRAHFAGLDLAVPIIDGEAPLDLHIDRATAAWDDATEEGYVEDTVARGAGGEVQLSATFGMRPSAFDLHVLISEPIEFGAYVPRSVTDVVGTTLKGRIHAFGNYEIQQVDKLDLWLGRAHLTGELVNEIKEDQSSTVHAKRLNARIGDSELRTRGVVHYPSEEFDFTVGITSNDLARWLHLFEAPAMAQTLTGSGRVNGTIDDPRANLSLDFGGVPIVDEAHSELGYYGGVVDIREVTSLTMRGSLSGSGQLELGARPRLRGFNMRANNLDLSQMPFVGGLMGGRVSGTARAQGYLDRLDASGSATADGLIVAGDTYSNFSLTGSMEPDGTSGLTMHVDRDAGGQLDVQTVVGSRDELGGAITLRALPLHTIAYFGDPGPDSPVGGDLDVEVQLTGTSAAPTADGTISLIRGWLGDAFIGSSDLSVETVGDKDGYIRVHGHLLQGKVKVDGELQTSAPYAANLALELKRVELDQFAPEMAALANARGWVSGTLDVETTLIPVPGVKPKIAATLTEAVVLVDNLDSEGRPAPIRFSNVNAMSVEYDGNIARLLEDVEFQGPSGTLTLSGYAGADEIALSLGGDVYLEDLAPYFREYFSSMEGQVSLLAEVGGSMEVPTFRVVAEVEQELIVRPKGQDAFISMPLGKIEASEDSVIISGVELAVKDRFTEEKAVLEVGGVIGMRDLAPSSWSVLMEGEISGKLLLVAARESFTSAGGVAVIDEDGLWLLGDSQLPELRGKIEFDNSRPLTMAVRGMRQQVSFTDGTVGVTDQLIRFSDVRGLIDDEGRFSIGLNSDCDATPKVCSEVTLEDWAPKKVDVTLTADALPFRVPKALDLTLNIASVRIKGNDSGLDIDGVLEVVDGRYIRKFNLAEELRPASGSGGSSTPFYEEIPLIANANLNVEIDARAFFVQNNIANIELAGAIVLDGTPKNPRFDGEIQVKQGEFKLQGMRAKFTRTRGSVSFSRFKKYPNDTPTLNLISEADYLDPRGQDHVITLTIKGTLNELVWDLFTSGGLNKGQTITLLLSGKTPEEFRKQLGDDSVTSDPTRLESTANTTDNAADQLLKDLAGDFLSLLLEDTLKNLTSLDVARLEITTGSIGFHVEKEFFKNLRAIGDFEQSARARKWDVRGEFRINDELSAEGAFVNENYVDDSEEDLSDAQFRIVYRLFIP